MNSGASITMLFNRGLQPDEEIRLSSVERDIQTALLEGGITARCGWNASDDAGIRIVELVIWSEQQYTILKLSSTDVLQISDEALIGILKRRLAEFENGAQSWPQLSA